MTDFTDRLNARRKEVGLTVQDVVSALQLQGIDVAYPTVASWFNGERGDRWEPETLHTLLEILQSDLRSLVGGADLQAPDISGSPYKALARELASLSEQQQAAVLSLIKSLRA